MKWFVPEVVQTSSMDCGPAALKCLLEGFGIPVSYGRLREACQTGIDGTSIDTMETVANQLGLDAEQIMIPADHLLLASTRVLPAIVVVTLPNGITHFVVVWRRHGNLLQVMDPAAGRRWVTCSQFLQDVYRHTIPVPALDWQSFAASDEFQCALRERLERLGIPKRKAASIGKQAVGERSWHSLASLDAAARMLYALVRAGALRGAQPCTLLLERLRSHPDLIPRSYWSVQPGSDGPDGPQLSMSGAVLVRVRGKRKDSPGEQELGPELKAALKEQPLCPACELVRLLWQSGPSAAALLLLALVCGAGGALIEALLFRGLFDTTGALGLTGQRLGAVAAILVFSLALLLLEAPIFSGALRLGRQIENRFRIAFLVKIPRLGDRYFQSRLTSDMAERSHATRKLRDLGSTARELLRSVFELCATAAGIVWLEPAATPFVLLTVAAALAPAFTTQPLLAERDLRTRSHAAGLTRFYLDAMLGLLAIRAHGAERSVRREQEKLLGQWAHSAMRLQRMVVTLESIQLTAMFGLVACLLLVHPLESSDIGRALLIAYWALNLPALGQEIGAVARQYPLYRNITLRLLEPLGAAEERHSEDTGSAPANAAPPSIKFKQVSAEASGHTILRGIDLEIEPGSQIAIVGPSGAGKSSLVGILLGWLKPSQGEVQIDGEVLDCERLRGSIAWVDPAVQLWNRSLFYNLSYGSESNPSEVGGAIDAALLRNVLENLPDGLQTKLGEGGALVSGGEGQRVRLARAMLRKGVRLVILDEPFRGLDRAKRHELLTRARDFWCGCTMLCITHDLEETRSFDRVLVVEHGQIVEDGSPADLAAIGDSRYAQLLAAETETRSSLWSGSRWRRIVVEHGQLVEDLALPAHEMQDPIEAAR